MLNTTDKIIKHKVGLLNPAEESGNVSRACQVMGLLRDKVGFDAGKKVKGRKRHIFIDTLGLILKAEVHSASIQDRDGAALVFDKLMNRFPFIEKICGDGGYQGARVRNSSPAPVEIDKRI